MAKYCHLSYEDRKNIEYGLNENKSINQIAKELGRNHSTILREIDRNKKYSEPSAWNNYKINHPDLDLSCGRLKHSPYVCNGCKSRSGCRKIRWTYYARESQKAYDELIKSCRQGINLTLEEIHIINENITPLVKKGQATNHLYINHPNILDFPRIVKYKKRKDSNKRRSRKEREILVNRKYTDFIEFTTNNPDLNIVEMDTVEGLKKEGDCFLTLFWRKSKFMLIFKLESQTTNEVTRIFEILQTLIPLDIYKYLFQVILTDNGHEFFDVNNIECIHSTGEYVTHLFFCDPHASRQKGMLEKNHEFIRYVLPKGSSFKNITQEDCDLIMNHINSLCRDSLNGKSPYEAMLFLCDEYILKILNCYYIEPDNVNLSENLLKY